MTRAILVNHEHNYVAYAHQRATSDNFETEPHASLQVLIKAKGTEAEGATLYLWRFPCFECAKAIVYAGIKTLVYKNDNEGDPSHMEAQLLLEHSSVEVIRNEEIDF